MNKYSQIIIISGIVLFIIFVLWFFSEIVFFVLIALVLSMIGRPMVNWLNTIHIKKHRLPNSLSAFLTLLFIIFLFSTFFMFLIPILINEAKVISSINIETITQIYQEPVRNAEAYLRSYNLITQDQTLVTLFSEKIMQLLHLINFPDLFSTLLSVAGTILISIFVILFITFFFLKDAQLFNSAILLFTPVKYQMELKHILITSRIMISRYFTGLLLEILSMTIMLWIGLSIIGINNALLIAFIGGVMVIIPYIGVIIGCIVALGFGVTTALGANAQTNVSLIIFHILIVYGTVKLIDDFILQPLIYSNSVKAHPLEIFLVILMAGSMAGVVGMILAIPTYTFLRIVAKEFLSQLNFVQKLTERL